MSEANSYIFDFLRSLCELESIPDDVLKKHAEFCRFDTLEPGEYITIEGESKGYNGFIVVSGCLAMIKTSSNGKELIVELLQGGDIFGMLLHLALQVLPAQLSAKAIQPSLVLWMPINNFTEIINGRSSSLLKEIVAHLLICLQSSYKLSRGLAHDKVDIRIASALASLAIKFRRRKSDDFCELNFTRQQLADITGTTSETAIRVTRAMQKDGLIDLEKPGRIKVLDLDRLSEIAEFEA